MTAACRSCGAPMLWARTRKGRRVPLDVDTCQPWETGALVIVQRGPTLWAYNGDDLAPRMAETRGISETRARELLTDDHDWHLSHFATCPHADQHRSRQ